MTFRRLLVPILFTGVFLWVFADALFGSGVFAFRDAGHFYYPLFQFVGREWAAGRVPLWNPYENLGMPLAGNAAASVFYPGKLVFALPLDYALAYNLYVMGHVLLAAWAAYRLARHWGGSVEAAGVAALSYAFSGNVLFQYCNVIFLVGAAWLPLAVLATDHMLARRSLGGSVGFGVVLALMTLGGNAEMAYHAVLLAAMYALWLWWTGGLRARLAATGGARSADKRSVSHTSGWQADGTGSGSPGVVGLFGRRPVLLAVAVAAGLALSAIQVLPSAELTGHSARAPTSVPRTLYEIPTHVQGGGREENTRWTDGLTCRRLPAGSHHEHVYHFSVGPWRLAEYVWPNFGGRQFPIHRRWLDIVPAEGRLWVPSLYMGLVPLALAMAVLCTRRTDARTSWLAWVVMLSLLAGFGWFGLGWLLSEIRAAAGADPSRPWAVGPPFGGLYWLMTVLLPGYVHFRYPAKLLVVTALGLSMLAATGWDRARSGSSARLRRALVWLAGISLVLAAAAAAVRPLWLNVLAAVPPDVLFGPLDAGGAVNQLIGAFLHTAVVAALFWLVLRFVSRAARWPAVATLILVAVDLALANRWMVVCVTPETLRADSAVAAAIQRHGLEGSDGAAFRVARHSIWLPPSWQRSSSPDRIAQSVDWDRQTLWPKHNLSSTVAVTEVSGTMTLYDCQMFLAAARAAAPASGTNAALPALLAQYAILPGRLSLADGRKMDLTDVLEDVSLWHNPRHLPRAWIVHDVEVLPPLDSDDPTAVWQRTVGALSRDLRRSATVETAACGGVGESFDAAPGDHRSFTGRPATERASSPILTESCRVIVNSPLRVEISATLARPGLVVLADQFYPGWKLEVETAGQGISRAPILRTNRVMRGAWLPAGQHRLVYRYRPVSFLWGAAISSLAWIALAVFSVYVRLSSLTYSRSQPRRTSGFPA